MERNGQTVDQVAPGDGRAGFRWWEKPAPALLGMLICAVAEARFEVETFGREHLRHAPGALVIANHRYDTDGPLLGSLLMQRRRLRLRFEGVAPFFVAREDLFRPGFLGAYLPHWPRVLRAPLYRLSIGPVLRGLGLRPIRRIPEHSTGELLPDVLAVLGDRPLAEVLRPQSAEAIARELGRPEASLSVRDALRAPRELLAGRRAFRRSTLAALRALQPHERDIIERQLQVFVELLEAGETVVLEPEGTVSRDGRFGRPRRALHHLLNTPARIAPVLPVALSYDSMRPGRPRVLIRVGEPRMDLRGRSRRETDAMAGRAILQQWAVNASHLAARHFGERGLDLSGSAPRALERYLGETATRCEAEGIPVDPLLLDPARREERVQQCVAFWRRRADRGGAEELLRYFRNELDSIASVHPGLYRDGCR
ncbi:MAG TPA: hypothetical protein VFA95_15320 [Gammaproteobacteria bacterium]|nr:hypothetical protein [Gammaproteobacteria bacterium]